MVLVSRLGSARHGCQRAKRGVPVPGETTGQAEAVLTSQQSERRSWAIARRASLELAPCIAESASCCNFWIGWEPVVPEGLEPVR
jgi:hypothetical protein